MARPTGGKSKFNPEGCKKALELAKVGNYRSVLARAAFGCSVDMFFVWLRQGREEAEKYPEKAEFLQALEQAEAEWEAQTVKMINSAAQSGQPNTWQAGMTMLERKSPDQWGKRETRVIEGGENALPQINILVLNDPSARDAHRDLLRSVDAASRSGTRLPLGPGLDSRSEDTSGREDDLDVA